MTDQSNEAPPTREEIERLLEMEASAKARPFENHPAGTVASYAWTQFDLLANRLAPRLARRVIELEQDLATAERCHEVAEAEVERLRGLIREAYFEGALDGWLHVPNPTDQQIEPWWEDSDVRRELEARSDG